MNEQEIIAKTLREVAECDAQYRNRPGNDSVFSAVLHARARELERTALSRASAERTQGEREIPKLPLVDRWAAMDADELREEVRNIFHGMGHTQFLLYEEIKRLQSRIANQRRELDRFNERSAASAAGDGAAVQLSGQASSGADAATREGAGQALSPVSTSAPTLSAGEPKPPCGHDCATSADCYDPSDCPFGPGPEGLSARLRADSLQVRLLSENISGDMVEAADALDALKRRLDKAMELKVYAEHALSCEKRNENWACTCGLDETLGALKEGEQG